MPTVEADGRSIHYETAGSGETVTFVGDAGLGPWQWGHQFEGVAGPRQALVWDLPGTGRSDPPGGALDVDSLAADVERVLVAAGVDRAHLVGAGLGGMVALRYAREYGRTRSLALFGLAASGDAVDEAALRDLHPDRVAPDALRESLEGAFSADFLAESPAVEHVLEWRADEDAREATLERHVEAMLKFEAAPRHEIGRPALVFHGVDDPIVPPVAGETLAEALPRGEFVPVDGRHLARFEHGLAVTDRLVAAFDEIEG